MSDLLNKWSHLSERTKLIVILVFAGTVLFLTVIFFTDKPNSDADKRDRPPYQWSDDLQNLAIFKGQFEGQELNFTNMKVKAMPPAEDRSVFEVQVQSQYGNGIFFTISFNISKGINEWKMVSFKVQKDGSKLDDPSLAQNWLNYNIGKHYKCDNPNITIGDSKPSLTIQRLELELDRNKLGNETEFDWQTESQDCKNQ